VSLAIDTGTIHRRRFLDLVLRSTGSSISAFLYDAVEQIRFALSEYGKIVGNVITHLRKADVKIKSIVGDNQAGQVMALAHWSPKWVSKNRGPECRGIRFQACICHIIQLVMKDSFFQSAPLKDLDETMLEMIVACNISEVVQLTQSHCPVHVVTRWFSPDFSLSWLLGHEQILSGLDLSHLNANSRTKIAKAITAENFAKLKILRSILAPFTKCVRFSERNDSSISVVLPIFASLESFLDSTLRS
jgi:hypothetical protein